MPKKKQKSTITREKIIKLLENDRLSATIKLKEIVGCIEQEPNLLLPTHDNSTYNHFSLLYITFFLLETDPEIVKYIVERTENEAKNPSHENKVILLKADLAFYYSHTIQKRKMNTYIENCIAKLETIHQEAYHEEDPVKHQMAYYVNFALYFCTSLFTTLDKRVFETLQKVESIVLKDNDKNKLDIKTEIIYGLAFFYNADCQYDKAVNYYEKLSERNDFPHAIQFAECLYKSENLDGLEKATNILQTRIDNSKTDDDRKPYLSTMGDMFVYQSTINNENEGEHLKKAMDFYKKVLIIEKEIYKNAITASKLCYVFHRLGIKVDADKLSKKYNLDIKLAALVAFQPEGLRSFLPSKYTLDNSQKIFKEIKKNIKEENYEMAKYYFSFFENGGDKAILLHIRNGGIANERIHWIIFAIYQLISQTLEIKAQDEIALLKKVTLDSVNYILKAFSSHWSPLEKGQDQCSKNVTLDIVIEETKLIKKLMEVGNSKDLDRRLMKILLNNIFYIGMTNEKERTPDNEIILTFFDLAFQLLAEKHCKLNKISLLRKYYPHLEKFKEDLLTCKKFYRAKEYFLDVVNAHRKAINYLITGKSWDLLDLKTLTEK